MANLKPIFMDNKANSDITITLNSLISEDSNKTIESSYILTEGKEPVYTKSLNSLDFINNTSSGKVSNVSTYIKTDDGDNSITIISNIIQKTLNMYTEAKFNILQYAMSADFVSDYNKRIVNSYIDFNLNTYTKVFDIINFLQGKMYYAVNMSLTNIESNINTYVDSEELNIAVNKYDKNYNISAATIDREQIVNLITETYEKYLNVQLSTNIEHNEYMFETKFSAYSFTDSKQNYIVDLVNQKEMNLVFNNTKTESNIYEFNTDILTITNDKRINLSSNILNSSITILGEVSNNYVVVRDDVFNTMKLNIKKGFNTLIVPLTIYKNKILDVYIFADTIAKYLNREISDLFELFSYIDGDSEKNFVIYDNKIMSNPNSDSNFKLSKDIDGKLEPISFIVKSKVDLELDIKEIFK